MENPYQIALYCIPGFLAFIAGMLPSMQHRWRVVQAMILGVASATYWYLLQLHVSWAYDHPANPNDGAPKTFALLFGWLFGLVFPIVPVWFITRWIRRRRGTLAHYDATEIRG